MSRLKNLFKITFNDTNTYLLIDDGEACIIDAAAPTYLLEDVLKDVDVKYILITHVHPRHVKFLKEVKSRFSGEISIHRDDLILLNEQYSETKPDILHKHMQKVKVGNLSIVVLHTPGHTDGSTCFTVRELKILFSGDTLLKGGYGRISNPHSMGKMVVSLKNISRSLSPDTIVYPGHGPETKICEEVWLDGLDMLS
ncbi:MAG: MBL fold metallo-hydrolase [Nitrososphaerota archaeon]|nr:MBL fold metallo-hydrolase [Nitrososphaerota archaeon]